MYPECRHVKPSGEGCRAAALSDSHWCYYHARMHSREAERQAERDARVATSRNTARLQQRQSNGRFTPAPPPLLSLADSRPRQSSGNEAENSTSSSRPEQSEMEGSAVDATEEAITDTLDYGTYPVSSTGREDVPFDLAPIEDAASIQLALIEVAQALAANRIDPKRAGLLLYALQVASTNAKNVRISCFGVRSISYTDEGQPLAPQEYGMDIEDYEDEECEGCEACNNEDED